jgi:hypothetical protein
VPAHGLILPSMPLQFMIVKFPESSGGRQSYCHGKLAASFEGARAIMGESG